MKKLYLIFLCMVLSLHWGSAQKKIIFQTARTVGNNLENSGRFLNYIRDLNNIVITGISSGPTDLSLTSIPRVINANLNQDIFCASFTDKIDSTIKPVLFSGNGYDFINEVTIKNSTSNALMGGHYNGTISILTKSKTCNSPNGNCGFLAMVDKNCQPFFFKDIQSTGSLTIPDVEWTKNDNFVVGINYSGSFTIGLNTVTAKGLTDAYLAVCDTFLTPKWGVTLSAPGYEFIDAISYNEKFNEITATMSIDPLFSGPVTYTSSSGFTTTLTPTSYAYNNVIIKINADNGNLLDHTVIGSPSNYNIEDAFTSDSEVTYIAGSANSELHPDQNNLSLTIPNKGETDIVALMYKGLHNFEKGVNLGGPDSDALWSLVAPLRKIRTNLPPLPTDEFMMFCGEKGLSASSKSASISPKGSKEDYTMSGALFVVDNNLNLVDSLYITGTGMSQIYSADMDMDGNIYIAGDYTETADFDPSENTFNLVSAGGKDMFIAKYNGSSLLSTAIIQQKENSNVKIYPIPAQDKFYIEAYFGTPESGLIQVLDISGRIVMQKTFQNESTLQREIPINLPPGILFVKIFTSKENMVKKLLVQR